MSGKKTRYGVALMLLSAAFTCCGQLLWKLSSLKDNLMFAFFGLCLYGCGALLMIVALRYGKLSTLHPLLAAGYVLSLLLGVVVLNETVTPQKALGVAVIICGLVVITSSERKGK